MSDVIISVENVAKKYRLQHQVERPRYTTLRDVIVQKLTSPFRRRVDKNQKSETGPPNSEDFWALNDVSFEVKTGDVVGIIGRNGAGKSTLLKILSRITEPTKGRVRIIGRVASLLEVGTGFHPELTGRENIFLNGAILGMHRAEIKRKFDEIVAFADVERFLDTPVKRYSSGMYVRLAFAVAAHLEPEILIVDEVLAVGDAGFQKKCLGKMQDVASQEGRTVLFVSHNMAAVSSLTRQVVVLDAGRIKFQGPTEQGLMHYLAASSPTKGRYESTKSLSDKPYLSRAWINSCQDNSSHISGNEMNITFEIRHQKPVIGACFAFVIVNQFQQPIVHCWIFDANTPICRHGELTRLTCRLPRLALNVGRYSLTSYLSEPPGGAFFEKNEGICEFDVEIVGRQTIFGWHPDTCAYIADYEWTQS
jgi:lipopolysaccharide transport system ATP-binding protein